MNDSIRTSAAREDMSDQTLVDRVRSGDSNAYGTLWQRHAPPAYAVARSFQDLDADDLVSEAFAKVLEMITSGGGPTGAFRPYLTMTVRNLGRTLYVRQPLTLEITDTIRSSDDSAADGEHAAVATFERTAVLEAFESLPVRWQEVLWYSEIDGLKVGAIGKYLNIKPNAVSALLIRAKRGLRDAWIVAHLARSDSPECRAVLNELGAYTRQGLSRRATTMIENHLSTCHACTAALKEARHVSHLMLVLLPAVVGIPGAATYLLQTSAPPMPESLMAMGVTDSSGSNGKTRSATALITGASVLLAAGGVVVALALFQPPDHPQTPESASVQPARSAPATPSAVAPTATPLVPAPEALPTKKPEVLATDTPKDITRATPSNEPSSSVRDDDSAGDAVGAPPAPQAVLTQVDDRMFPRASGESAQPGATIQLLDEDGIVVGSGTARADGSWRVQVSSGDSGAHSVSARQIVAGQTSPLSDAMPFETSPPPRIESPVEEATVNAISFPFSFTAPSGTVIEREIVGVSPLHRLKTPSNGHWNERVSAPPGTCIIRVRYADPLTGDFGPYRHIRFTTK